MPLARNPHHLLHLERALTAFVSPLQYASVDEWRSSANSAARTLLGADCATFMLPHSESNRFHSDEWPPEVPNAYPSRVEPLDRRFNFWRRQLVAGVWSRRRVFNRAMYRSSYYNDFVVPVRAFDAIGITIESDLDGNLAGLLFHHTSPRGRRFGDRGLELLRLLRPALIAGVRSLQALSAIRRTLASSLDHTVAAIALVDSAGHTVHANAACRDLLQRAHGTALRAEIEATARAAMDPGVPAVDRAPMHVVTIDGEQYHIHVTAASNELDTMNVSAIVTILVDPSVKPLPLPVGSIAARFGLTAQEARVASLLGERHSNREIATLLGISGHTARHHTERVLAKMGVHSRRAVGTIARAAIERPDSA